MVKSIMDGIERAQDEIDLIDTNGRVRGVACLCLQHAESTFDGHNRR